MPPFQWLAKKLAKRDKSQTAILDKDQRRSHSSFAWLTDFRAKAHHLLVTSFESPLLRNATLLASGAVAWTLEFITHMAVSRTKMPAAYDAFVDARVVALMTIALVGVWIRSAAARQRAMLQQIRIASDLNHHLRNALQVITQSRYLPEEKQAQAVLASIDRIEEALKQLNPQ
jgi:hypothetical protein